MHSYNLQGVKRVKYLFDEGRPMTDKPLTLDLHIELELKVLVEVPFQVFYCPQQSVKDKIMLVTQYCFNSIKCEEQISWHDL